MTPHYFTFGADHVYPDGQPASGTAVIVEAERNHRALFMAWLGSNRFAFEYDEDEFNTTSMSLFTPVAYVISVNRACPVCGFRDDDCHCLIEEEGK